MSSAKVRNWRQRTKQNALIYKGGKCIVCSYNRTVRSIHFHHVDPTKKQHRIGCGITRSWEKIKLELDKCVVLCSNCHGEVHDGLLDLTPHLHKNPSPKEGDEFLALHGRGPQQSTIKKIFKCKDCSVLIQTRSIRCRSCASKAKQNTKILWPPIEELQQEVQKTSRRKVSRRLGVSDTAVKKRLLRHLT